MFDTTGTSPVDTTQLCVLDRMPGVVTPVSFAIPNSTGIDQVVIRAFEDMSRLVRETSRVYTNRNLCVDAPNATGVDET